jgi:hypothetical protein
MNVGRLRKALLAPRAAAAGAFVLALGSLGFAWGFVVDDALLLAAFARVVKLTGRHAFFVDGPLVDGATPFALPWLVAPLASSTMTAFEAQRLAGGLAVATSFTWLAWRVAMRSPRGAWLGALVTLGAFPLAAHATSGLETGLATGAVCLAFALAFDARQRLAAAFVLGLAATLRPELVVAAMAAAFVLAPRERALAALGLAAAPSLIVALVRIAVFGSPLPLAVLAKPSDLRHGALYAVVGLLVTNLALALACAPHALREARGEERPLVRAALALIVVQAIVVAAVGGDWMPYARLLVPAIPCAAIVAAFAARSSRPYLVPVVLSAAVALQGAFGWRHRAEAASVAAARRAVIAALTPALAGATRVAGLDVGFLAASHEGPIVDLAGLTDPAVARLRGGHTSKAIPEGFLDAREVDALVLWAPHGSVVELGPRALFGRVVETRLARSPAVRASFTEFARVPWDARGAELVVFRRRLR